MCASLVPKKKALRKLFPITGLSDTTAVFNDYVNEIPLKRTSEM